MWVKVGCSLLLRDHQLHWTLDLYWPPAFSVGPCLKSCLMGTYTKEAQGLFSFSSHRYLQMTDLSWSAGHLTSFKDFELTSKY